jgi:hypothetical protein
MMAMVIYFRMLRFFYGLTEALSPWARKDFGEVNVKMKFLFRMNSSICRITNFSVNFQELHL